MNLNMNIYRTLTIVSLLTGVITIAGCKSQSEGKKGTAVQPSQQAERTFNPGQYISIHEAALNGQTAEVMRILNEGISVNTTDEDGRTALMYGAFNGHTDLLEKLIRKGADVNLRDNFGRTALMFASSGSFPDAVRLLLKNQADPNIADSEEHFTALMYAAAEGHIEVVKVLLTFNANPELKDIDGDYAITFAEKNGHNDVAKLLQPFLK